MITKEEFLKHDPDGLKDLDCSLEQIEKEMNQNLEEMAKDPGWRKYTKADMRDVALGSAITNHSRHFFDKFCEGGGPDEITNPDGTPYVPGQDD